MDGSVNNFYQKPVHVENGLLLGVPSDDKALTVFKGVPYAAPPVGDLRWKAPQRHADWDGVRRADRFAPVSIQPQQDESVFYGREFYTEKLNMSEDCLYLNIWTPAVTGDEKLPVMVWVHGGAFKLGYSSEKEFITEAFARKGVIYITIAYRLGALGFMAHPELSAEADYGKSGNYGLLDQIAALQWVNRNIESFGGDKDNVTIFGQSAGAASVQALITSPLAKGLFNKAILQSGGGISTFGHGMDLTQAEEYGVNFVKRLGAQTLADMRKLSVEDILKLQDAEGLGFRPIVDNYVLKKDSSASIVDGEYPDMPIMIGTCSGELNVLMEDSSITAEQYIDRIRKNFGDKAEGLLQISPIESDQDAQEALLFEGRDRMLASSKAWAITSVEQKRQPVYRYYFNKNIPDTDYRLGAFHSSELWYVFMTLDKSWRNFKDIDYKLADIMNSYWVNFAKTGNPNGADLPQWTAWTMQSPNLMLLGEDIKMGPIDAKPKYDFLAEYFLGRIK